VYGHNVIATVRVLLCITIVAALWREVAAEGGGLSRGDALRWLEACVHMPARLVVEIMWHCCQHLQRWGVKLQVDMPHQAMEIATVFFR
jgi:hypothetical protein